MFFSATTKILKPLVMLMTIVLMVSCDTEKSLLESVRRADMEIIFERNRSKNESIVRNRIPVEVKVIIHSDKFGDQDVTDRVIWEYDDSTLGKVIFDSTLMAYAYFHNSTTIGFQKITAQLENYIAPPRDFEVSPVELVKIRGDIFMMGSEDDEAQPDEKPVHEVVVNTFLMSKYEVTNLEYLAYLKERLASGELQYFRVDGSTFEGFYTTGSDGNEFCLGINQSRIKYDGKTPFIENTPENNFEDYPVTGVTWKGASLFAQYYGMRLPTEAEWEYACKGKTMNSYPEGKKENLINHAWYFENCSACTTPQAIGQKQENIFGLFDIYGNVLEWCYDFYQADFYTNRPKPDVNPTGPDSTGSLFNRVVRGGGFKSLDFECRSSNRESKVWNTSEDHLGFRVVRSL